MPLFQESSPGDFIGEGPNRIRSVDRMPQRGDLIALNIFHLPFHVPYLVLGEAFRHTKDPYWYVIDLLDISKQTIKTEFFDQRNHEYYLIKATEEGS